MKIGTKEFGWHNNQQEELFRYSVIVSSERNAVKEPVAVNGILEEYFLYANIYAPPGHSTGSAKGGCGNIIITGRLICL